MRFRRIPKTRSRPAHAGAEHQGSLELIPGGVRVLIGTNAGIGCFYRACKQNIIVRIDPLHEPDCPREWYN